MMCMWYRKLGISNPEIIETIEGELKVSLDINMSVI